MLESLALNVAWFSSWNGRGIQDEVRAKQNKSTDLHESDAVRFVCKDLKIRCILFGSMPLCDGCRLQWKSCNKESVTVKPNVIRVCEVTLYFYNTCPLYRRISCVSGGWHAFLKFSAALKMVSAFTIRLLLSLICHTTRDKTTWDIYDTCYRLLQYQPIFSGSCCQLVLIEFKTLSFSPMGGDCVPGSFMSLQWDSDTGLWSRRETN